MANGRFRRLILMTVVGLLVLPALPASAKKSQGSQTDGPTWLHEAHRDAYTCETGGVWHFVLNQTPRNADAFEIEVWFSGEAEVVTMAPEKVRRRVQHFYVEGAGTLENAQVSGVNAKLVLSDFTCDDPPDTCAEADIAVSFPTDQKLGNEAQHGSVTYTQTVNVSIDPGTYYMVLGSSDSPHGHVGQNHEQWRAVFDSNPVEMSSFTNDLPEGTYTAGTVVYYVLGQVTFDTAVTQVTAEHWALTQLGSTTPDSLQAVCAGLTAVNR
jgi:hypothetical protein